MKNHVSVVTGIIILAVSQSALVAIAAPLPDPRTITQNSLSYGGGDYALDNIKHLPHPYESFCISVDKNGIGHVKANAIKPVELREKPNTPSSNLSWNDKFSYLDESKNWKQLTLVGAKEIWGEPRKNTDWDHSFYTFDAHNTNYGEPNIYHLDLIFDDDGQLTSYRVRGIGITNPQFVSKPKVQSKTNSP